MGSSSETFPPKPSDPAMVEALVSALRSVITGDEAMYVSSPLTTGPRAFEWHRRNNEANHSTFVVDVVEPNREDARAFVQHLRHEVAPKIVVDPTAMPDLADWNQSDYRYFWGRVVEELC